MKEALKLATALAQALENEFESLPFHVVSDDDDGVIEEIDDQQRATELYNLRESAYEILTRLENLQ